MKLVKRIALILIGLVVLSAIALGILIAQFDADAVKQKVTQIVLEKTQRKLDIAGDVSLNIFPDIGISTGALSLSESNSENQFAAIKGAKVSVQLMPLFSKQLVADKIELNGVTATLKRDSNGNTNFDDLLQSKSKKSGAAEEVKGKNQDQTQSAQEKQTAEPSDFRFDVEGISLKNSNLTWVDSQKNQRIQIGNLNLDTGQLGNSATGKLVMDTKLKMNEPAINVQIQLSSGYNYDIATKKYALSNTALRIKGDAADLKAVDLNIQADALATTLQDNIEQSDVSITDLELSVQGTQGQDKLSAEFSAPKLNVSSDAAGGKSVIGSIKLQGQEKNITAELKLSGIKGNAKSFQFDQFGINWKVKQGDLDTEGDLNGKIIGNLTKKTISIASFGGDVHVAHPGMPMEKVDLPLKGDVLVNYGASSASGSLATKFDESSIEASWKLPSFSPLAAGFDVNIDKLNVDKYFPPEPKKAGSAQKKPSSSISNANSGQGQKSKSNSNSSSKSNSNSSSKSKSNSNGAAADTPVDLSALKGHDIKGSVKIGNLQVQNIKLANLKTSIQLKKGSLNVAPVSANLYGGSTSGSLSADANTNRIGIKQTLNSIHINPLMKDFMDQDILEGQGNVALNINMSGTTVNTMKKSLAGTVKLKLKNGAYKGINIAKSFRTLKARLSTDQKSVQQASQTEQTDFSDFVASFRIAKGVAYNNDLSARSPLLRLSGDGNIDIGNSEMNYLAKATLVSTSTGQGGKEMASLKGIAVPIRISGPFDNLSYGLDFNEVLKEAGKAKLNELKAKAKEKIEEKVKAKVDEAKAKVDETKAKIEKKVQDKVEKALGNTLKGLF